MEKITVKIDLDNVINNFTSSLLEIFNTCESTNYTLDDITSWNLSRALDIDNETLYEEYLNDDLLSYVKPIEGAVKGLNELNNKFNLLIVTSRNTDKANVTFEWVERYIPFIKSEQVIFTSNKENVTGDVMIDDKLDNLLSHNNNTVKILFNYPWNQESESEDKVNGIIRLNNWGELIALAYDNFNLK